MTTPLYQGHNAPGSRPPKANTGLWYDKFCNQWVGTGWQLDGKEKWNWLRTVTGRMGEGGGLEEALARLAFLVQANGGRMAFFKTTGRFVTGLGRAHPVENGMAWHHTLGIPCLPATSVKGMVRDWAEAWWEEPEDPDVRALVVQRVFGQVGEGKKGVGSVVFFDALPAGPFYLDADIMTPHYVPYYRHEGPPGDWYSPTPIPFLTVAAGAVFAFGVALRGRNEPASDLELVLTWLSQALQVLGAGAKSAGGYGRFEPVPVPEQFRAADDEKATDVPLAETQPPNPLQQEMEKDGYIVNPDIFMTMLTTKWLDRMESVDVPPEVRQEIAALLATWYQKYKPGQWQKPKGKNEGKIGRILKVLNNDLK